MAHLRFGVLFAAAFAAQVAAAGLMTDEEFVSATRSNVERIPAGTPIVGIVMDHHGADDKIPFEPISDKDFRSAQAKEGIIHLTPRTGARCWMNDETIEFCDRIVDYLIAKYSLPKDVRVISKGGSMGGAGAIVWARYTRHNVVAVFTNCGVMDLPLFAKTRKGGAGIPEAYKDAADPDEAIRRHSPIHLVKELPDVPYFIFHTLGDPIVPAQDHAVRFVEAMKAAGRGGKVTFDLASGGGHCSMPKFQWWRFHRAWNALLYGRREPLALTFTFDDASADHMIAATALEKFGWRGAFNVVTAWVDRETATPQEKDHGRALNWAQCKDLVRRGHGVYTHSAHHVNFKTLVADGKMDEVREEIVASRDAIAKNTGKSPEFFTYPFVCGTKESDALIVEAGMKPMTDLRIGFGGPCPEFPNVKSNDPDGPNSLAKVTEGWYESGVNARDFMLHGIDPKVGVWRPFRTADDFERSLPALKELEKAGKVVIFNYDEFYDFAVSRSCAPRL